MLQEYGIINTQERQETLLEHKPKSSKALDLQSESMLRKRKLLCRNHINKELEMRAQPIQGTEGVPLAGGREYKEQQGEKEVLRKTSQAQQWGVNCVNIGRKLKDYVGR